MGLFTAAPVLSMKVVPRRVRMGLGLLIVMAAQATLPEMPHVQLDSTVFLMVATQQILIGMTFGVAALVVMASNEFPGELVGLQMRLNFASFFAQLSGGQATPVSRFYGTGATCI